MVSAAIAYTWLRLSDYARMPPVESKLTYTKGRDIHSAGVVLLQMLLGRNLMQKFENPQAALHLCMRFHRSIRRVAHLSCSPDIYFPFAQGARHASPGQEGWCILSDASFGLAFPAFSTY